MFHSFEKGIWGIPNCGDHNTLQAKHTLNHSFNAYRHNKFGMAWDKDFPVSQPIHWLIPGPAHMMFLLVMPINFSGSTLSRISFGYSWM